MKDMTAFIKEVNVRPAVKSDAETISGIYNYYIEQTAVTFEEETVSAGEIHRRIQDVQSSSLPWFVAELAGQIVGYAYAARWMGRRAYRFSTEVTVYVSPDNSRCGIGSKLYDQLLSELRGSEFHVALGGIALPNDPSIALHEKFGFTKVAHLKEVGFKFNRWIDVGYWQLIL